MASSSRMVVVCFSEPPLRRMSSANLRLERFLLRSCSASLTQWLNLFHFPVSGFMMYCRSGLNKSVLSGSPCLVPRSRWDCLLLTSECTCSLLDAKLCEPLYVWLLDAMLPLGLPYAAVFICLESLIEVNGCDHSGWCHSVALCPSCWNVNRWSVVE